MSEVFRHPYTVALHDSDAAGIMFSANLIRIFHQGYEAMMTWIGFGMGSLLKKRTLGLPIVHVEGDFLKPLHVGDEVDVTVRVGQIGESSYRIDYELIGRDGVRYASGNTVHVCVDPKDRTPIPVPEDFKRALLTYS